jgi:hypothetical protein
MKNLYKNEMETVYEYLRNKQLYIMFDETTDRCGRFILNNMSVFMVI